MNYLVSIAYLLVLPNFHRQNLNFIMDTIIANCYPLDLTDFQINRFSVVGDSK